jgi:hypothetical protein
VPTDEVSSSSPDWISISFHWEKQNLEKNFRIEFVWQIFLEKPWTCYRVAPTFHSWAPSRFRMPFCWNAASALW